jgi:hypothetical protein
MVARATTDPSLLNEPAIRAGHFGVVHRKALRLAFAAGADQELNACCTVLDGLAYEEAIGSDQLREARRPKPPSLKECALKALEHILRHSQTDHGANTIRRALEALPND